jgi:hypothetical protein
MMWFEQGLERWGRLRPSRFVVSHPRICYGLSLRSRPPRTIGVATCPVWNDLLIIRDVVESVSCSDEWEFGVVTRPGSHGVRGVVVP